MKATAWSEMFVQEYLLSFSKLHNDWGRLNSEYLSIYIDTFQKTLKSSLEGGRWEVFHDVWLAHMDAEFEGELGSDRFSSILADYMNSVVEFRSTCRRLGVPMEYYDVLFYHAKKNFLQSLVFPATEQAYSTPFETVYRKGKTRLLRYSQGEDRIPVLIVYAQINRFHIMDISPDRSVVKSLMARGLDVYVLDWGYSGREDDCHSLEDYVALLGEVVGVIKGRSGRDSIPMVGYCWGGLISVIFAALHKSSVQCLALLATPVDFSKDRTLLSMWAKALDADRMIGEYGHMNGQILDLAFVMRNPPRNLYDKYAKVLRNATNKDYVNNFLAVEKWLFSTPPVPGALWRQLVNQCYKSNLLVKGEMVVSGRTVDLREIDMPLLCATAEKDDLVSPASTLAINDYASSTDRVALQIPGGHVGLCIGKAAHEKLWPEVARWLMSKCQQVAPKASAPS